MSREMLEVGREDMAVMRVFQTGSFRIGFLVNVQNKALPVNSFHGFLFIGFSLVDFTQSSSSVNCICNFSSISFMHNFPDANPTHNLMTANLVHSSSIAYYTNSTFSNTVTKNGDLSKIIKNTPPPRVRGMCLWWCAGGG
ncbi:MAG: hypothetical protein LBD41_03320, partial [Clostridiales Family XIII bacterium]|nr:hypothetical protein [Clostridiales Family XIII bacterium]